MPPRSEEREALLAEARERLESPGEYLACEDGDQVRIVALDREWTRIGRSLAADVRFDDPTVSRRHALIVRQADGVRVLDDRSLNGVFVNGERVEWRVLADGDEIVVGRYRLHFLEPGRHGAGRRHAAGVHRLGESFGPGRPAEERTEGLGLAGSGPSPPARRFRATLLESRDGPEDRGPLPEGRHRQDDGGPHADRRLPRAPGSTSSPSTSIRRATCRTTSTSIPRPARRSATSSPGARRPRRPSTTASSPPTSRSPRPSSRWPARWAAS